MTKSVTYNPSRQIEAEAFAWVAQIDTGKLSPADEAAFNEWLSRSPAHRAEFEKAVELSKELSVLTELFEPLKIEEKQKRRKLSRFIPGALATACSAFIALVLIQGWLAPSQAFSAFYSTQIGEYVTTELPDGSTLKLNTNSAAEVEINNDTRIIRLAKGEAFFDVAKDPDRAFVVYAGDNIAKAVGTSFSVRIKDDNTELIVLEGVVEFSERTADEVLQTNNDAPPTGTVIPALTVTAGHRVAPQPLNNSAKIEKLTSLEKSSKLSWTEGLFDFSGLPLEDVIQEVNRHTTMRIEIADPELRTQKFGGIFRIGDVETLVDALEETGISIERQSDSHLILRIKS